jgi:phage tail sheath gpL-like
VVAQGQTGVTYPTSKAPYTSAGAAGAVYGYKSAIYLALRELFPANGDGVGVIPVTVYPMVDAPSSVAAAGDITPSGTATLAGSYQVRVAGISSLPFVIPAGAVSVNKTLRDIATAMNAVLQMPVTPTFTYGSVTASALVGTGNGTITALSVTGTPLPGAYTLTVNTAVANGGVWTLTDPNGTVISTTLTQTVGAGAATVLSAGGIQFTITDGTTDFGLGATFTITVPATKVNLTAGWKGTTGNLMKIEIIGPNVGVVFAVTAMTGGLVDPDPTSALNLMGNIWETFVLNTLPVADTAALDVYQTFGEGRWGVTTHQPLIVFTGTTHTTVALATAVSSTRKTDRINALLAAPGSPMLPFVVAARMLARIAVIAGSDPASDYCGLPAETIIPGADDLQWDWPTRDQALKAGCSTSEVVDRVVQIGDVITFWAPTGEDPPAYRNVVDVVKVMNIIFNMAVRFSAPGWKRAPLIPDGQATVNPNARKPSAGKAEMASLADVLALAAIISDPAFTKKSLTSVINSTNPNRLDVGGTFKISGNSKIKSVNLFFGFFFGTPALVA